MWYLNTRVLLSLIEAATQNSLCKLLMCELFLLVFFPLASPASVFFLLPPLPMFLHVFQVVLLLSGLFVLHTSYSQPWK